MLPPLCLGPVGVPFSKCGALVVVRHEPYLGRRALQSNPSPVGLWDEGSARGLDGTVLVPSGRRQLAVDRGRFPVHRRRFSHPVPTVVDE